MMPIRPGQEGSYRAATLRAACGRGGVIPGQKRAPIRWRARSLFGYDPFEEG